MPASQTKSFDAVEMSRRLREGTSRKLATLNREERIALLNAHIRASKDGVPVDEPIAREEPSPYPRGGEQEESLKAES